MDSLKSYPDLPEAEKAILRLKALLFYQTPADILRSCFLKLSYLSREQQKRDPWFFKQSLENLKVRKFLNYQMVLPEGVIHQLTVDALSHPYANQYIANLKAMLSEAGNRYYSGFSVCEARHCHLRLSLYQNHASEFLNLIQQYASPELLQTLGSFFAAQPFLPNMEAIL